MLGTGIPPCISPGGLGDGVLYRNIAWVHIFMCLCRGGVGRKVNLLESEL